MNQIMTAAELVYNEYGYYPNDSHGSITCPRDIDIAPGVTWGKYINLCEDPFGRPYEWDNVCADGITTRKADGSHPTCPPNSVVDPGFVGVTMVGKNNNNDGCSEDDICYGVDGHSMYGWMPPESPGGGETPPTCQNFTSQCQDLSQFLCSFRSGCSLNSSGCSGEFQNSCSPFLDQTSCQNQSGCNWIANGNCGGSPPLCSTYSNQSSCNGASGCAWQPCSGTPSPCSNYSSNQTSCQGAGCTWASGGCSGTVLVCSTWNGNQATCLTQSGCTWSAAQGGKCNGSHLACSTYVINTTCQTNLNCTWAASGCSGTPNSCSSYSTAASCSSAGCTGIFCSGSPASCGSYSSQPSCISVSGCTWADSSSCQGQYSSACSAFSDQTSCQAQSPCVWGESQCTGSAVSCETFSDQPACSTQAGCSWQ